MTPPRILITSAGLEQRSSVLAVNEYRLKQHEWWRDLECLISNQQIPHLFTLEEEKGLVAEMLRRDRMGPGGRPPPRFGGGSLLPVETAKESAYERANMQSV